MPLPSDLSLQRVEEKLIAEPSQGADLSLQALAGDALCGQRVLMGIGALCLAQVAAGSAVGPLGPKRQRG